MSLRQAKLEGKLVACGIARHPLSSWNTNDQRLGLWARAAGHQGTAVAKTCLMEPPSYNVAYSIPEASGSSNSINAVPCTPIESVCTPCLTCAGCQSCMSVNLAQWVTVCKVAFEKEGLMTTFRVSHKRVLRYLGSILRTSMRDIAHLKEGQEATMTTPSDLPSPSKSPSTCFYEPLSFHCPPLRRQKKWPKMTSWRPSSMTLVSGTQTTSP